MESYFEGEISVSLKHSSQLGSAEGAVRLQNHCEETKSPCWGLLSYSGYVDKGWGCQEIFRRGYTFILIYI